MELLGLDGSKAKYKFIDTLGKMTFGESEFISHQSATLAVGRPRPVRNWSSHEVVPKP